MGKRLNTETGITVLEKILNDVVNRYKKINENIVELQRTHPEMADDLQIKIDHVMNDFMERLNGEALEPFDIKEN